MNGETKVGGSSCCYRCGRGEARGMPCSEKTKSGAVLLCEHNTFGTSQNVHTRQLPYACSGQQGNVRLEPTKFPFSLSFPCCPCSSPTLGRSLAEQLVEQGPEQRQQHQRQNEHSQTSQPVMRRSSSAPFLRRRASSRIQSFVAGLVADVEVRPEYCAVQHTGMTYICMCIFTRDLLAYKVESVSRVVQSFLIKV